MDIFGGRLKLEQVIKNVVKVRGVDGVLRLKAWAKIVSYFSRNIDSFVINTLMF